MSADYAVKISYTLDGTASSVILEAVDSTQINMSSQVTSHPISNGREVSDHMIIEPISISIRGVFAPNGQSGSISSMYSFQTLFERLKNEAVICKVVKMKTSTNGGVLFKSRSNMVLQDISWTENITSLSYSFSFKEVINYNIQFNPVTTDAGIIDFDSQLLNITSLSEEMMNFANIDSLIMEACLNAGLATPSFLIDWVGRSSVAAGVLGLAGGSAATWIAGLAAKAIGVAALPGVGQIAAVGIAAVVMSVALYNLIKELVEQDKYRNKIFSEYNDTQERYFSQFYTELRQQLLVMYNEGFKCYNFVADETQTTYIGVGSQTIRFDIEKYVDKTWLQITDPELLSTKEVHSYSYKMKAYKIEDNGDQTVLYQTSDLYGVSKSSVDQCTKRAALFTVTQPVTTSSVTTNIWILCTNLEQKYAGDILEKEGRVVENAPLTDYYILVSDTSYDQILPGLKTIVENALKR